MSAILNLIVLLILLSPVILIASILMAVRKAASHNYHYRYQLAQQEMRAPHPHPVRPMEARGTTMPCKRHAANPLDTAKLPADLKEELRSVERQLNELSDMVPEDHPRHAQLLETAKEVGFLVGDWNSLPPSLQERTRDKFSQALHGAAGRIHELYEEHLNEMTTRSNATYDSIAQKYHVSTLSLHKEQEKEHTQH